MSDRPQPPHATGGRSHLDAGSRITGELHFPGTVELPGYVKGRVEASEIVIEETGAVEGQIQAASITIKGRFKGDIRGGTVSLHASARITGDIVYERLSIDSGAHLEGRCKRQTFDKGTTPADRQSGSGVE